MSGASRKGGCTQVAHGSGERQNPRALDLGQGKGRTKAQIFLRIVLQ